MRLSGSCLYETKKNEKEKRRKREEQEREEELSYKKTDRER